MWSVPQDGMDYKFIIKKKVDFYPGIVSKGLNTVIPAKQAVAE